MVTDSAVFSLVSRSCDAMAVSAKPHEPIELGTMLVLNLGLAAVPHSSSAWVRLNCALNSTGRPRSTTQEGATEAMRSRLLAEETQDLTLHEPGSDTSAVST